MKPKKKKCKVCKSEFDQYNSLVSWCSSKCGYELSQSKLKEKRTKEWRVEKKRLRTNVTDWKKSLQNEINKIVRLIDKDLSCLARNTKGQMHAGHVYARGGNTNIRYNLHNIHRQSAQSNHFQNDDGLLREGLSNEYGKEYMEFISDLRRTPVPKYSQQEYMEMYYKARKIVLRLKKSDINYSLKNRILLRNKINLEMGVYEEKYCIFEI